MKTMDDDGRRGAGWIASRSMRSIVCTILAVAGLASANTASAATIEREGARYEDTVRLANTKLVLNGVGVRGGALFKAFVAGLYLPEKESEAEPVYSAKGPKRISVRMLLAVGSGLLAKTFGDGIRKNYKDDQLEPLRERMDVFDAQLKALNGVDKGDTIDLDYQPASGTHLLVNGKARGDAIGGEDFYVALLKMFIGERAVDKGLRAGLLGQPAP